MSKAVAFKNRDRFIQLGVAIAALRKLQGLSQEMLAEKAGISRALLSAIEAPGMAKGVFHGGFLRHRRCTGHGSRGSSECSKFPRPNQI